MLRKQLPTLINYALLLHAFSTFTCIVNHYIIIIIMNFLIYPTHCKHEYSLIIAVVNTFLAAALGRKYYVQVYISEKIYQFSLFTKLMHKIHKILWNSIIQNQYRTQLNLWLRQSETIIFLIQMQKNENWKKNVWLICTMQLTRCICISKCAESNAFLSKLSL